MKVKRVLSLFFVCIAAMLFSMPAAAAEYTLTIENNVVTGYEGDCVCVEIPSGVTGIGGAAFMECGTLTAVVIPESVTSVGRYAFRDCTALTDAAYWGTTAIDTESAFEGCTGLSAVKVTGEYPEDSFCGLPVERYYRVSVGEMTGGSIALSADRAKEGETVELTVTAEPGYLAESLTVSSDGDGTELSVADGGFTMPAGNVTVSAVFVLCGHEGESPVYTGEDGSSTHAVTYSCCGWTTEESHTGGTVSCSKRAVCENCGAEYGDTTEHTADETVGQTCKGWFCSVCGTAFGETGGSHVFGEDDYCTLCGTPEDYGVTVSGIAVTAANAADVLGTQDMGARVTYDAATKTLTLNYASTGPIESDHALFLELVGPNVVAGNGGTFSTGILSLEYLYIYGTDSDSSLTVKDSYTGVLVALKNSSSSGNLTIKDCAMTVVSDYCCLNPLRITVKNSRVTLESSGYTCIDMGYDVIIGNSVLKATLDSEDGKAAVYSMWGGLVVSGNSHVTAVYRGGEAVSLNSEGKMDLEEGWCRTEENGDFGGSLQPDGGEYYEYVSQPHITSDYIPGEDGHFLVCGCGTGIIRNDHYGGDGTATCSQGPVCDACGARYGEPGGDNHDMPANADGIHECCGAYESAVLNGDVYEISNIGQLYWFAGQINAGQLDINGRLTADILLNDSLYDDDGNLRDDLRVWTPIGSGDNSYGGVFDGQNFVISGLYLNDSEAEWSGLFGVTRGLVKNVNVVESYITGGRQTGGIAGFSSANIINCSVYATITGGDIVGGITGRNTGDVIGCDFHGSVSGDDHTGGITGLNNGILEECWNQYGSVSGARYVGGIAGQCYGSIKSCYNLGTVVGRSQTGGVVGEEDGTLIGCYSSGAVTADNASTGGVVGFLYEGSVTNSYYNSELFTGSAVGYNYGTLDSQSGGRTGAQFKSGEVCWLLNGGVTDGSQVYYQTCGVAYPAFTGQTVYQISDGDSGYSNTEGSCEHSYGQPEFVWAEDGESCNAVFTCQINAAHTETVGCTVVVDTGDSGKIVCTATVTMNGTEYSDTVEIEQSLSGFPGEIFRRYRKNTVTSADREIILKAIGCMEDLLAGDSLSEENRDLLETLLPLANGLIQRIDEADAADETENILKAGDITAENARPEDKAVLTAAKTDLEKALEMYPGNYTAEEKAAIEKEISRIDAVLKAIEKAENDQPSEDKKEKAPPTGDGNRPILWLVLLTAGIYALVSIERKRKTAAGE